MESCFARLNERLFQQPASAVVEDAAGECETAGCMDWAGDLYDVLASLNPTRKMPFQDGYTVDEHKRRARLFHKAANAYSKAAAVPSLRGGREYGPEERGPDCEKGLWSRALICSVSAASHYNESGQNVQYAAVNKQIDAIREAREAAQQHEGG